MDRFFEEKLRHTIRDVENFPKQGIVFKDLTTVFKNAELLEKVTCELFEHYKSMGITKVAGVESRGFVVASALAIKLKAGFIPIRKPGKLPAETLRKEYTLEYGTDAVEIHKDAIESNDIVLLHDDLLATGGTSRAAFDLISAFNPKAIYVNFIIELAFLNGRRKFNAGTEIFSLLIYNT
jgi:adenine phosphoribosyltransferase